MTVLRGGLGAAGGGGWCEFSRLPSHPLLRHTICQPPLLPPWLHGRDGEHLDKLEKEEEEEEEEEMPCHVHHLASWTISGSTVPASYWLMLPVKV